MRGEVEVWDGDELVFKEDNMLVNGAGSTIADLMTVSPSYAEIPTASGILDASNYTIQAISFGTGSQGFKSNAHTLSPEKIDFITNDVNYQIAGAQVIAEWDAENLGYSVRPDAGLPSAPNPEMSVLELDTNVSGSFTGSGVTLPVSAVFPGNGQHVNFLPSAIASAMMAPTQFSHTSSMALAQAALGAFPEGSGIADIEPNLHATRVQIRYPQDTQKSVQNDTYGVFNSASSMDVSGFVTTTMSGSPHHSPYIYQMSSPFSGLTISGGADVGNSGVVEYSVILAPGDMTTVNMYGGIYHLGLWTIDVEKSLQNGNTPPFAFSVLNNPRKYKLFARKGLSKNLCFINDNGSDKGFENYTHLLLKWRIHFI